MLENSGFHGLGIAPGILQVLAKMGFSVPTPIQVQSIPIVIDGKDMMGIAQTGTGKTLAFGIPLIQKTLREKGIGLVVVPTRELAEQVSEALGKVGSVAESGVAAVRPVSVPAGPAVVASEGKILSCAG